MALKTHLPFGPAPVGEPLSAHKTANGVSVTVRDNEPWTLWFKKLYDYLNDLIFECCAQADRWLPEATALVNLSSVTPRLAQFSLIQPGFVTFSGQFDATVIDPDIETSFEMSLPLPSAFAFDSDAGGSAAARAIAGQAAAIFANTANGTLQVQLIPSGTGERTMNYSGSYWITKAGPAPPSPIEITTICPVDQPVLDEPYTPYQMEATGGKKPYHWSIGAGALPTGMTIHPLTGVISGTPTVDGTFPYSPKVSDSSEPPLTAQIDCEFVIDPIASAGMIDIAWTNSSPRTTTPLPPSNMTATFWLLDVDGQKLYRSTRLFSQSISSYIAWQDVTSLLPATGGPWVKLMPTNTYENVTTLFGENAEVAVKPFPAIDPGPIGDNIDYPFERFDTPSPIISMVSDFSGPGVNNFWGVSPDSSSSGVGADGVYYDAIPSGYPTPPADLWYILNVWGTLTHSIPATATWKKVIGANNDTNAFAARTITVVGYGSFIQRFRRGGGFVDTDFVQVACPSGNWEDGDVGGVGNTWGETIFAVGNSAGANILMYSADRTVTWTALGSAPAAFVPVRPKLLWVQGIYVTGAGVGNDSTFVVIGGNPNDPANDILMIPMDGSSDVPLTPILAVLPSLPAGVRWGNIAIEQGNNGGGTAGGAVLISGITPDGTVYILRNDLSLTGTAAVYNDWTLLTLADPPF